MKPPEFETSFFVGQPLKVLIVDDSPQDAERCWRMLKQHGYRVHVDVVAISTEVAERIRGQTYDVVLCELSLPGWTGLDVLQLLEDLKCQRPFIVVTRAMPDSIAAELIEKGADDYIFKERLQRLPLAVRRVMREQRLFEQIRRAGEEREQLIAHLQDTLAEIKRLKGLLPMCVRCKRVRSTNGLWNRIEFFIERYSDARVSPSLCPACSAESPDAHAN